VWGVLGHPARLAAADYRWRYERGDIASAIVDVPVDATWRGEGELYETEDPNARTQFERQFYELNDRLRVWSTLSRVDKLSRLGDYAALLIGAAGEMDQELPRGRGPQDVLYLTPFAQDDATWTALETNTASPRFGLPVAYTLKRTDVASPQLSKPVHWSRVVHVADKILDDELSGTPALRACWNDLENLDKVKGGGAESFWLRANAGLHFDVDKTMSLEDTKDMVSELKKQAEAYKHQLTRWLRTRGVTVETLGSEVADFKNPLEALQTIIAGTARIPVRILFGSERGELASTQDRDNWEDTVNDRRTTHAGPNVVRPLFNRLIAYNYMVKPAQYSVRWPQKTMNPTERAAGAAAWAKINAENGRTVFTEDEIRDRWYGMAPLDEADIEDVGNAAKIAAALERTGSLSIVVRKSDAA
jgi:hypothetical protein